MAVSLAKGSSVSLTKEAGPVALTQVRVGLGWDAPEGPGLPAFDLDASAFILGPSGRALSDQHFIFYNNLADVLSGKDPDWTRASVAHHGDNRTGEGDGDDEQISVFLDRLSSAATRVVFTVTIHEANARSQTFGQVRNAFIRVVNAVNDVELARFDLSSGASYETAIAFGELYRDGDEWRFGALGEPLRGGLAGVAAGYGINV